MIIPLVRFLPLLLSLTVASTAATDLPVNPAAENRPLDPALPTLFIAGDSTAAPGSEASLGWGVPFPDYFDPAKINVVNLARGGRSSRTFITEGLWDRLIAQVKAGDFVLIQFGHNDGSPVNEEATVPPERRRSRGSLPGLGEETVEIDNIVTGRHEVIRTFGWYLRKMIADVQAKGATPILLSLTVRHLWTDGRVERGSGQYRVWIRELARSAGIGFIDHTRLIADEYQRRGEAAVKELFPRDYVHTSAAGADLNAALVVAGLKGLRPVPFKEVYSSRGEAVEADRIGWLNLPEPADPKLPSLVLIGDSTVRNGGGDGANGEWGWGDFLGAHFDPAKVNLVNRAIGGLSSRTFRTQGHWERALTLVKPGDFVLMQFGHNDAAPLNDDQRARGTIKGTGEETEAIDNLLTKQPEVVHTYGWYLRQYIREARAAGATPVVCSPVPRKTWQDDRIVRSTTDGYAAWARQVAEQEGAAFVDLNDLVATRYEALGAEAVNTLFADAHTHTSRAGAELNAGLVAGALRALPGDPLAAWAK
ncbi:putative rhamnogalacturonan acetylesterase YesY [Lacunisphaera limnophila]|uniref:Putative rhamnogalacturonan acetylesterase YesY n=1 Tax=Lacunisphaera limnophila TaxID=1838286 RepID=A0A1D8ATK3_9BACT|nr:rhamnogalacturonan acetylesterase [Lacunisphaera limnophila]AOS44221.1 putative rhamnogalacturonan acetylesterase YesY [Lacunisphaera limnophila]